MSAWRMNARAFAIVLVAISSAAMPRVLARGAIGSAAGAPGAKAAGQAPAGTTTASPARAGTARIRGRVVHADTGSPLRRAQVSLSGDGGVRREVTTDGEGRYEFSAVPAGRVTISASKTGHLTLQYGQQRPFTRGRSLTVGEQQTLAAVDLALPRAGAIAGRVSDDRGEPRVGAIIAVQRYQYDQQGRKRLAAAAGGLPMTTDDRGEFRAFGLMPGEYVVSATVRPLPRPAGQAQPAAQGYLTTYYPGTPNEGDAQPVTIGIGEEAVVQFALVRGRLSRVSGSVADSAGRPAAGATLSLATRSGSGMSSVPAGSVAADGSFTIANVPPGEHSIQVRLQSRAGDAAAEMASATITAPGADVTDVRIRTTPGATLTGRVEWQGKAPRPAATGAASLRITAAPVDGRPMLPFNVGGGSALVNADDTFRLTGLIGRLHIMPASLPEGWALRSVVVDGADVTDSGIDASGLTSGRVRVVLTDRLTELSGIVMDAAGGRAPDAVAVVLPENAVGPPAAARYVRALASDQGGTFQTRGLPPGRYVAAAVEGLETGSEWDPAFQAMVRSAGQRFTLAEGQTLRLELPLMR